VPGPASVAISGANGLESVPHPITIQP
jgi:hypothetical protein